jgi:predicted HTH domain antitoxin
MEILLWRSQMQIQIPDGVAHDLQVKWGDLERKLLEIMVIEAYREGAISTGKVRELLELPTRLDADLFLKSKAVYLNYDEADFTQDMLTMQQLEQAGKLKPA